MLLAALDLRFQAIVGEVELQAQADPVDQVAAAGVQLGQPPGDRCESVRLN